MDVDSTTYEVSALIYSGVDSNVLSYSAWKTLSRPSLVCVPVDLQSFSCEETSTVGKCTIPISIQGHLMHTSFYVAPKSKAMVDMVLGRSWNIKTNFSLDWVNRKYTLQLCESGALSGDCAPVYPSLQNMEYIDLLSSTTLPPPHESEVEMHWIVDTTSRGSHGWHVPLPSLEAQGYGRASTKFFSIWLPKQAYKPLPPYNHTKQLAGSSTTPSSKCQSQYIYKSKWVPKDLLKAQGYYTGATAIWIPREKRMSHKVSPKPRHAMHTRLPNTLYQWKPKKPQPNMLVQVTITQSIILLNNVQSLLSPTRHAPT